MPSQEDYLDNLLKDVTESGEVDENVSGQDAEIAASEAEMPVTDTEAPDLDAVSEMSADEIDQLLSAGTDQEDELLNASDMDLSDEDVMKMLEESDDEELQDIQDMLQKSDNNEAVDDSIAAMLEDYPEEDLEAKIVGGGDENSAGDEKKRLAEAARKEKRELARLKKEKQKEEAAARKAEKKAAREAAKAAKEGKSQKGQKAVKQEEEQQENSQEDERQEDLADQDLFDPSVLDSIVSEADRAGQKEEQQEEDVMAEPDIPDSAGEQEQSSEPAGLDGGELDLDSLFGGDGDADLLADMGDDTDDVLMDKEDLPAQESGDAPKGKQGFFARIMNFLTEEDEEENENIKLSKENKDILDDLDKEEKGAKGKKGKKGKDKAKDDKKAKEKPKKEPKPKKAPKPKKEKPVKEEPAVPGKKLSFKKVLPVVLVGVSVGVLLFVFINSVTDYADKKTAKTAYYEGDYQTCYQNLFGKDLNETESIMFGKSESILYIRLWIREYEMFMAEGDRVGALDSLIQTIDSYPGLYSYAGQWNAEQDIAAGYAIILNYLSDEFGLTEGQAQAIAAVRSDREYTKMVTAIAGGRTFENWDAPATPEVPAQDSPVAEPEENQIPDMLPEEDGLGSDTFIDNQ